MEKYKLVDGRPAAYTLSGHRTQHTPMSRAQQYLLIASGELKTFMIGKRRMVLMADADAYLAAQVAKGSAVPPDVSAKRRAASQKGIELMRARRRQSTSEAEAV